MGLLAGLVLVTVQEAVRSHLQLRAADLEREFLPAVRSAADFEALRPRLREEYLFMLGLSPLPERTPLNATVTGRFEGDGTVVENLHFQSRPGLYVTANLYRPKAEGRHPAVLYLSGHSGMGRNGNKTAFQDHGIWFAAHGYVCLVLDTLQLGEIAAIHHGTYRFDRWWWHSAGYTPAGVECWNAVRALDYLESRPEVDPARIGATGISGGGAATFWIAAADERVKVAVPVSGMADLGFYVTENGVDGHCDCMFLVNSARWNWTTIGALVCPRPLLFANSDNDGIFPMSANERVINRLERLYAHFGAGDRVEAVVSVGGHAYRTDLRREIFEFFNRHLKGDARTVQDPDAGLAATRKPEELRAFPGELPADEINTRVDELFVPAATPGAVEPKELVKRLRATSFAAWPAKPGFLVEGATTATTEPGIVVSWEGTAGASHLVVLGPEEPLAFPDWARDLVPRKSAILFRPRGRWTRKSPPNTVERSFALVGTTADAGRVWDVICAAERFEPKVVVGRGNAGIIGAVAALYQPKIAEVVVVDPPPSHRPVGPAFLSVLRVMDIPEELGCLAPRPLTLIGASDPAFDRTAEFYRRAGAQLKR